MQAVYRIDTSAAPDQKSTITLRDFTYKFKKGKLALRTKGVTEEKLNRLNSNVSNKDAKLFLNILGYFYKEKIVNFIICIWDNLEVHIPMGMNVCRV